MSIIQKLEFDPVDHRYSVNGATVPSVTQVIGASVDNYSFIDPGILEHKAWIGTGVAECLEIYNRDGSFPSDVHDDIAIYLPGYEKFRAVANWEPEFVELPLYSQKYGFAGTLDEAGLLEGERAIIDTKTVVTVFPSVGLQVEGYKKLVTDELDAKYADADRYALQLDTKGGFKLVPFTDRGDWGIFLSMLQVFKWKLKNKVK